MRLVASLYKQLKNGYKLDPDLKFFWLKDAKGDIPAIKLYDYTGFHRLIY